MRASHPWRWTAVAGLLVLAGSPALARDWAADNVRGTVLTISEGRWAEFDRETLVSTDTAIRTLQSGRVTLSSHGESIVIGPNTALELFTDPGGGATLIRHYAGTLTLTGDAAAGLRVEAGTLVVTPGSGIFVIRVAGERAEVNVAQGGAIVLDSATGRQFTVAQGDVLAGAGGVVTVAAAGGGAASGNGVGAGGANPGGNGNGVGPGGNGVGAGGNNAGGNGNGIGPGGNGAGGNGGNNAGGNGNGIGPGGNGAGGNGGNNVGGNTGNAGGNNAGGNANGIGPGGNNTGNGSGPGGNNAGNGNGGNAAGDTSDPAPAP